MEVSSIVIVIGLAANLLAVVSGFVTLIRRIEDSGNWRGVVQTTLDSHTKRLDKHGVTISEHERWIARHEGASGGPNGGLRREGV